MVDAAEQPLEIEPNELPVEEQITERPHLTIVPPTAETTPSPTSLYQPPPEVRNQMYSDPVFKEILAGIKEKWEKTYTAFYQREERNAKDGKPDFRNLGSFTMEDEAARELKRDKPKIWDKYVKGIDPKDPQA